MTSSMEHGLKCTRSLSSLSSSLSPLSPSISPCSNWEQFAREASLRPNDKQATKSGAIALHVCEMLHKKEEGSQRNNREFAYRDDPAKDQGII